MLGITAPCLVTLSQRSTRELNVQLILEKKSARQNQKLKTLSQYVQRYPSGWKKRLELAELLYETGDWEQAVEQYYQVVERQPQLIQVRVKQGKLLQLMGRVTESIAVYEQALSRCRNPATSHHIQGLINLCREQPEQANNAFATATSIEPQNPAHWLALGQVQMSIGQGLTALSAFDQILSLQPDDLVALLHSHDVLLSVNKFKDAEVRLRRAEALAPQDYAVLKRRVAYCLRMSQVEGEAGKQTKKMVTAMLRLAPHSAEAHQLKAEYYCLRGEWKKTNKIWQQFTAEHPKNPQGWYYYALFLLHRDDKQGATQAIFQAHQLDSNNRDIKRLLDNILSN